MAGLGAPSSQLGPPIHGGKEEMTLETEKSSSAEDPMAQRMLQIQQSVSFQLRTRQPLAPTPIRCVMDLNKTRFGQFGALPQSSSQPYVSFFFLLQSYWVLHRSCQQNEYHARIYSAQICA